MSTTTITRPIVSPTDTPIDTEVADALGDDILLSTVRDTKPQRVRSGSAQGSRATSGVQTSPRAWTFGGSVD